MILTSVVKLEFFLLILYFVLMAGDKTPHLCPIITVSPPVAGHRVEPPIVTCHALVTYLVTMPRHPS